MSLTPSNMIPLGTIAPKFSLLDTVSDNYISLQNAKGDKGTVIMFICNHCPFVVYVNSILVEIANTYAKKGLGFIAISSNDAKTYPQDGPQQMKILAEEVGYPFPYLYDESQDVAKAYDAACTPDLYLFNAELKLVYRGQLDESRPENGIPVSGNDLKNALDCLLNNEENTRIQKSSIGCNIKWKNGSI